MAKYGALNPRPFYSLPERQKRERRLAKSRGFKNEYAMRAWIRQRRALAENKPSHLRKGLRSQDLTLEIRRVKRGEKLVNKKADGLIARWKSMQEERAKLDNWSANQKYHEAITAFLEDPGLTAGRRRQLMRMERKMNDANLANEKSSRKIMETTYQQELP